MTNHAITHLKISHKCHTITREHWIQRMTFAVETNVKRLQSRCSGRRAGSHGSADRHTDTHIDTYTQSTTIPSPLAKRRGEGNNWFCNNA